MQKLHSGNMNEGMDRLNDKKHNKSRPSVFGTDMNLIYKLYLDPFAFSLYNGLSIENN